MKYNMIYAEGDINSDAKGSGARANAGKVSFSLVPMHLMAGMARVFMGGKLKYTSWNWAKCMDWSICVDCIFRHLFKWWFCGEDNDPESGESHLDHIMCNILMLKHYSLTYKEGDDRPAESTSFSDWMGDINNTFDEEAYLERNPDIKELIAKREADVELETKVAKDSLRQELKDLDQHIEEFRRSHMNRGNK